MRYLTVMSPVRRLKKLFSYYSIIWRNSTLSLQDDPDNKDNPDDKDDPDDKIPSQFLLCLLVKWLHRQVHQLQLFLINQKTGSNGYGNSEPLWISEFGPTLTQTIQHLNKVYFKNHPI